MFKGVFMYCTFDSPFFSITNILCKDTSLRYYQPCIVQNWYVQRVVSWELLECDISFLKYLLVSTKQLTGG